MKTIKFCCRKTQLCKFQITLVANIFLIMGIAFGSKGNSATRLSVDGKTEIAFNRKWAEEAFSARIRGNLSDRMNPGIPFSFVYGGKNSTDFLDGWKKQVKDEKIDATKCRHTLTLTDPVTGLEVRAVATIYTNTAGVDWTLYFTNNGTMDSPVIEQVNALDVTIKLGENQNPPVLHRIKGGGGGVDDWMPFDEILNAGQKKEFAPTGGRSSFGNTPWFNLQWNGGGVITAIGWTGQWKALVENSSGTGRIQAGMQNLHLKLLPGETIRSPRIMQLYWFGNDEIRAYNLFRQTMFAHILPKVDGKPISPPIVHLSTAFYEMDKGTEANVLSHLSAIKGLGFEYFWMDAYYGKDDFPTVGNYVFPLLRGFNLKRFPLGIKPIGEAVRKADMKFLMWFEYERICPGTLIAKEHPEWVVLPPDGGWGMFNLAIPEAREYIYKYLSTSIKEYGISWMRVDNAVFYESLWSLPDKNHPDRVGISEIRYIEGHYRLWDDLLKEFPYLVIDNCAAGGHRVDLETCSRSIPLWRTDGTIGPLLNKNFNQAAIQNQVMTSGLSRYVPFSASGQMGSTPYLFRSGFNGGISFCEDVRPADYPCNQLKSAIAEGKRIRKYYFGNFYPLTKVSLDTTSWCVTQYHRTKDNDGMIMAFRRPQCEQTEFDLGRLCEIDPKAKYKVTMYQSYEPLPAKIVTGAEFVQSKAEITETPGTVLIEYEKIKK
jgi:alpha-galactosidase